MPGGVLAVIPARYQSSRFPGKALASVSGIPMVVRVMRNLEEARLVDQVIVATDDQRIAKVVAAAGGEAVMTSSDLASGSDRVWTVAKALDHDIVVNVQGDEPLLPGWVVDALVERLSSRTDVAVATPIVQVPRSAIATPDDVTVALADDATALYFSRSIVPWGSDPVWRHLGVYAYRRDALARFVSAGPSATEGAERLEQLRALSLHLCISCVAVEVACHAVDRPEDVAIVERLLTQPG